MKLTDNLCLRRILNYSYHPFRIIPKPSIWLKRERLKRFVAWQYASYRSTVKAAYKKLNKTFIYMDMQRQDKSKLEIFYATERLNSALTQNNIMYPQFKNIIDKAHILLNKRTLAQLSVYEPNTFKALVDITQKLSLQPDKWNYAKEEKALEHVEVDFSILQEPFPQAAIFWKGASENHKKKPRLLKEHEF